MIKKSLGICLILAVTLYACKHSIKPKKLYGKWRYVKVESPRNPEENLSDDEVARANPFIEFTESGDLVMTWEGKRLSYGKFRVEGALIRYSENLPGGQKREFPFLVSRLTDDEIVFETMNQDPVRVTAKRQN